MNYRSELDGIRAVAVIPMVLFHAGVQQFSGGYIGVDIFFVVSGFLITSIFLAEKAAGKFSMVGFYERRARRILPALFLVVTVTMLFAWLWMTPAQLKNLAGSALSVVLYVSNLFFWQQGDYFGLASEQMPLLHTWSLAVEEQFYVIFPVFMVLIWRLGNRASAMVVATIALLSFVLAEWGSREFPSAAYYLTPTRAWELLAGVLAAYYLARNQGQPIRQNEWAAILGLGLLFFAIFTFDDATPFPGVYALIPVVGTLLIILFGGNGTLVGRLLSSGPMVWFGLLSYSMYLWHQPLFAYARILGVSSESHMVFILLGFVSVGLAYLTWRFVENPFRNRQRITKRSVFSFATATAVVTGSCAAIAALTNVGEARWTPEQLEVLKYGEYPRQSHYRERACFLLPGQVFDDFPLDCYGAGETGFVIWGDSHAASLHMGLFAENGGNVNGQFTAASCPPILGLAPPTNKDCVQVNAGIIDELSKGGFGKVVMAANWSFYQELEGWEEQLQATVDHLQERDIAVVLVGSLPQWQPPLPILLAREMRSYNVPLDLVEDRARVRDWEELNSLDERLFELARSTGANFARLLPKLCQGDLCDAIVQIGESRKLIAWDYSHLTLEGSSHVARVLTPMLAARPSYAQGDASDPFTSHREVRVDASQEIERNGTANVEM